MKRGRQSRCCWAGHSGQAWRAAQAGFALLELLIVAALILILTVLYLAPDQHTYEKPGKYSVVVKVVDIFGNDTSQAVEVEIKQTGTW